MAAIPALAHCEVGTVSDYPDTNYTTICVLDEGSFGDGTQTFTHEYIVHVSHAVEADSGEGVAAFDYSHVSTDQGTWTYDDGTTQQSRRWSDTGAGYWEGVRGVVGTGAQADLAQRDQTVPEDGSGACSGIVGTSTCAGASGWLTVQDVASVGVGAYYQQSGTGDACQQSEEVDVDAAVVFVPLATDPQPCSAELPWIYDALPPLPVLP